MGCTQGRSTDNQKSIPMDLKYLMPDLTKAVKLAQQCIYAPDSPISLTPVRQINKYFCKLERVLPSGSVKIRGAYHMLYRLLEKKKLQGCQQLNVVVSSKGNFSLACLEALKHFKNKKCQESPPSQQLSELLQDDTPTDPGMSAPIKDKCLSSRFKPYEPLGEICIFCKQISRDSELLEYQNVRIMETGKEQLDTELLAFNFADENEYEFLDQYNDINAFGGYATVGFEIEQWIKLQHQNIDYVFVTYHGGSVLAGIALYLKYVTNSPIKLVGAILDRQKRPDSPLCESIISALIDEVVIVQKEEVERAQCELISFNEITEFNAAIAYAACKKLDQKNSLVVLGGGNAQNLWKMLDDMAQSDPQQYQKFVKQNIQNGLQQMEDEHKSKHFITPQPCFAFKIWAQISSQCTISETDQKVLVTRDDQFREKLELQKMEKRVKIYVNLLKHPRVLGAFDKNDQATDDPAQYNMIPLSISFPEILKSQSYGTPVYHYDILINEDVFNKINKTVLQKIILDTLEQRIGLDRNPLKYKFYKCDFKFQRNSYQVLESKSIKKRPNFNEYNLQIQLEQQADKEYYQLKQQQQQQQFSNQKELEENDIQQLITQHSQQQKNQQNKKPLIEEVDQSKIEIPYQMTQEQNSINLLIYPNVELFKDLDLKISQEELQLETIHKNKLLIKFGQKVDDQNVSAKWNKKKKQLSVTVHKL